MTTYYQQVSAAYVLARQAEERQEPPKPDPHASFVPHHLCDWRTAVAAMDETSVIQDEEKA